jgi:hypothetical protein
MVARNGLTKGSREANPAFPQEVSYLLIQFSWQLAEHFSWKSQSPVLFYILDCESAVMTEEKEENTQSCDVAAFYELNCILLKFLKS